MPNQSLIKLVYLTAMSVMAMTIRDYFLGQQHPGFYFNLLVAWIPVFLLLIMKRIYDRTCDLTHPGLLLVFGLWLLFFPNSAYLVIDPYMHVRNVIDFLAYLPSIILGIAIVIFSFKEIDDTVSVGIDETVSSIILAAMFFASSFGLYLGLFGRWNSWDLFIQPVQLISWSWANKINSLPFCLISTIVIISIYCFGKKYLNPSLTR